MWIWTPMNLHVYVNHFVFEVNVVLVCELAISCVIIMLCKCWKIVVRNHKACSCMPDCWSWDRSSLCCCNCKQAWNEKWEKARPATKATFSTCQRSQDTIYHPIGRLVSSAKTCWQKKRAASGQIRCLHASAPLHAPSARCMHAPAPRGKNVFLTVT